VTAGTLMSRGIQVVSIDRDAKVPAPEEMVLTNRWVRPCLLSGRPVLMVRPKAEGLWENIGEKRVKQTISVGGSAG
jgi:hypothetical protein